MSGLTALWMHPWLQKLKRYRKGIGNLALFSGSTGIAQAVMMVYAILVARALGPGAYGVFAGAYALASLSSFMISWGMDIWMLRAAASEESPRRLAAAILRAKVLLGVPWGTMLVIAAPLLKPDVFSPLLVAICVVDAWSENSFSTHISALNITRQMGAVSKLMLFSRGGRLAGAVVLILLGQSSPVSFAAARAIFTVASLIAALWVVRPDFKGSLTIPISGLLRQSFSFGISEFLALIYAQADITMLMLLSGELATGIYSPASNFINALFVILGAGYTMAIPVLTRLKEQDLPRFQKVTPQLIGLFGLAGIGMTLATALFGGWVVTLILGESYQETGRVLVALSPILFLKAIEFGFVAGLVAVNWQHKRLGPQFISAAANILLNIWVIPRYHVYGVAWVYVISEVLLALGYGLALRQWFARSR